MKIFISSIIVYSLFSLFNIVRAQSIQGQVLGGDGQSLEFVSVKLYKNSSLIKSTSSNAQGFYSFDNLALDTVYQVIFSFTGYTTIDTLYSPNPNLNKIKMQPNATLLENVVVNQAKPIIETKLDRLVFNVTNTNIALAGDATDVLRSTPLVLIENNSLSIIGKGGGTVLINDRPVRFSGDDLFSYLKSIPSDAIESVEVITVPPAKFSAEGNAGVVNIKLKKMPNDFWSSTIRSNYTQGIYSSGNISGGYNYQRKKLTLIASAGYTNGSVASIERPSINYELQDWRSSSERRNFSELYNTRVQVDYNLSRNLVVGSQVSFNVSKPHSKDNSETSIRRASTQALDSALIGSGSQYSNNKNLSVNLNSKYTIGPNDQRILVDLDYYTSTNSTNRLFENRTLDFSSSVIDGSYWLSNNIGDNRFDNLSLNIDVEHSLKKLHVNYGMNLLSSDNSNSLFARVDAQQADLSFQFDDHFDFKENTASFFFTLTGSGNSKFQYKVGLRSEATTTEGVSNTLVDTYKNNYFKLFPSVYSSYALHDNAVFSLVYGKRIERPQYLSLNPFARYINKYYYTVGNPYLQPSYVDNIEFNFSNNRDVYVSLYTTFNREQIAQTAIPFEDSKLVLDTMQNFSNMFTSGVTAVYSLRKLQWLETSVIFNGYYRDIKQKQPNLVSDYNLFVAYISVDNNIKIHKKLNSQLSFFYYSPQITGIFRRTPRYNLNFSTRYKINEKLEAGIFLSDILKLTQGELKAEVNGVVQHYDNYYDTRSLRASLSYRFGSSKINPKQKSYMNEREKQRAY